MSAKPAPLRLWRLRDFVEDIAELLDTAPTEAVTLAQGGALLAELVRYDDWLPDAFAAPDVESYRQYLLHCESRARFSVVSFVWGPGQSTPIHNHGVWGLVGMLRGSEIEQSFVCRDGRPMADGPARQLYPGDVTAISPANGDIHQVSNALPAQVSVSIHLYGADIGAVHRSVFSNDGDVKPFVSTYANAVLPNIWGLSAR